MYHRTGKRLTYAYDDPKMREAFSELTNAGIESQISSDDGGGMLQSLAFTDGVAVVVDEASVAEAQAVLEEFRKGETALAEEDEV